MKRGWGFAMFILLFTVALMGVVHLPLDGTIIGRKPEGWIGDLSGKRVFGKGKDDWPLGTDLDFIRVQGTWYKIKGPVYIAPEGRIFGWHHQTTLGETGYAGKRHYVE